MKKLVLSVLIIFCFLVPQKNAHALDAKGKAFLVICTYGTVGGALLGFATMAFGTNSRAIAQGASLGLYAGIAFGSYVVSSHRKTGAGDQMAPAPQYNPSAPPPGQGFGAPGGAFGQDPASLPSEEPSSDSGGFFGTPQRYIEINEDLMYNYKFKNKKGRGFSPPIYINLFRATF